MELTYQQVLADQYEENAKSVLVYQQEYETEENVDEYEEDNYEDKELADKELFNRVQQRHDLSNVIVAKPKDPSATKNTLKSDTHIRNIVLNIDGAFRGNTVPFSDTNCDGNINENYMVGTSSSHFLFNTSRLYKNVSSVQMTSFEFSNTFYTFSADRGNTTFTISYTTGPNAGNSFVVTISDGNYSVSSSTFGGLDYAINTTLTALGITTTTIAYNAVTHRYQFQDTSSQFNITFPTSSTNVYNNGIGYNLGFVSLSNISFLQPSVYVLKAVSSPDVIQDRYIYLAINDWNLIDHQQYGQTFFSVFAKIVLSVAKNINLYDNNYANSTSKIYHFQQPVNIQRLEVKLLDSFGNVLNMNGDTFSMTLEMKQVNDASTYETLNTI
jgi:hypothetical protein